jgi:hypothetical protein
VKSASRSLTVLLAALAPLAAAAGTPTLDVSVGVTVLTGSGACEAVSGASFVAVTCGLPRTLVVGGFDASNQPDRWRVAGLTAALTSPVFGNVASATSSRIVQLDNGSYVELTISW